MGYKIQFPGPDGGVTTIADYVETQLNQAGGHGYGQLEQVEAELAATKELLLKLVAIVSPSMSAKDIHALTGATWEGGPFIGKIVEVVP